MSSKSKIEWTDVTWNPVTGCSKVSDGCKNCYAERLTSRFRSDHKPWTLANAQHNVKIHSDRLDDPSHWRKPRRVFVNSMSDLFHELVPDAFIYRVFQVMRSTPQHTYQVLTKRPERMRDLLTKWDTPTAFTDSVCNLPNVWLGVSVEDQRAANERIPVLLQTPAAVRFLSVEPMLEQIDLRRYLGEQEHQDGRGDSLSRRVERNIQNRRSGKSLARGEEGGAQDGIGLFAGASMLKGKRHHALVHRLVWRHVYGQIPPDMTINHKNGIKGDNRPENLELATYSQQVIHALHILKHGRIDQTGEKNSMSKLTAEQILVIRKRRQAGEKLLAIAQDYGVSNRTISKIALGQRWASIG